MDQQNRSSQQDLYCLSRRLISSTFDSLAREHGGHLPKQQTLELLSSIGIEGSEKGEAAAVLWQEMGLAEDAHITKACILDLSPCLSIQY